MVVGGGENTKRTTFNNEYFYVANNLVAAITPVTIYKKIAFQLV
jgi:hypothetical protein